MSLYKQFATDKNAEKDGVLLDYTTDTKRPCRFRVARMSPTNQRYAARLRALTKPYERQIALDTLPPEKTREIQVNVFVDAILLGWEGVTDENGVDLPFSRENARKLFADLPDLFDDLQGQASRAATFRAADLEDAAKN